LKLLGKTGNTSALGTKIELILDDKENQKIYREVNSGGSYGSSPLEKVIGIGKASHITQIKITWMNGQVQLLDAPSINQYYTVQQQ
jgi:hypothetical protein